MYKIIGKKSMAILLTAIMLFSMIPAFSLTASAATHVPVEGISVEVSSASSESLSGGVLTVTAKGGLFGKKTATVTVKNNTDKEAQISFAYTATSASSFTVASANAGASGNYSALIASGGTVVLKITSNSGLSNLTATLKLSNFNIVIAKDVSNVTFNFDESYGSVTVAGEAVTSGTVKEIAKAGAALVATPVNGARFLGWINCADNSILSTATNYTITPSADVAVKAIFIGADSVPHFLVGSASEKSQSSGLLGLGKLKYHNIVGLYIFDDLNGAASFASSSNYKSLVLLNDSTLPAGDYTIPSGVTLLIPFDDANTLYTTQAVSVYSTGSDDVYVQPTPYRILTMADGANITVNGAISLSAKHRAAQGSRANAGSPMGKVSIVKMEGNSKITIANGGTLYAYGFITGSGSVEALNGGNVYEYFQFMDFRGGSQSTDMDHGVFPLSQYYVQNIEVPLTLNYGSKEYAYTTIYMSSADFDSSVAFIGPSSAMFNLTSGYVTKWYDGTNDRIYITSNGDLTVASIKMDIGSSSINSSNYELPINSNYTVIVESGTITVNQDIALLPGAEIIVKENASAVLGSGKNIYIYDLDEWGDYAFGASSINTQIKPINYAPGKTYTRTNADLKDGMLMVYGTVDSTKGYVYTTAGGANICGADGGKAIIGSIGAETTTYQLVQAGKYSDGTAAPTQYVEIPLTPAKLANADGSYVVTNLVTGTYTFNNGAWNKTKCDHVYAERTTLFATCEADGIKTFTCLDTASCGDSYTESIPALGHSYEVVSSTDSTCSTAGVTNYACSVCGGTYSENKELSGHTAADEAVIENEIAGSCTTGGSYDKVIYCTVCGAEISRETISSEAAGHTYELISSVDPTCSMAGSKTYSCIHCGDVYTEEINALEHTPGVEVKENVTEAICTAGGKYDKVVYCIICNKELSRETVTTPAADHVYEKRVIEPTCISVGYTHYDCVACDYFYDTDEVAALGHKYEETVYDPTCTTDGRKEYRCSACSNTYDETIPATGHTDGEVKIENEYAANCIDQGHYDEVTYCAVCNERVKIETFTIPATGHTAGEEEIENEIAGSCTTGGSFDKVVYCMLCRAEISRETVTSSAIGHSYKSEVTAPDCQNIGYTTYTCSVCGDTYIDDYVEATGHKYEETVYDPTCITDGRKEYRCSTCGATYEETIPATGHTDGEVKIENEYAANCIDQGHYDEVTYCAVCNEPIKYEAFTTPALGHSYKSEVTAPDCENAGYTTYTCSVCGDTYEADEVSALGHNVVIDEAVEPTYENTGLTEGSHCDICGKVIVPQEIIESIPYVLGDANHDGAVDILDLITLKNQMLEENYYSVVVDMDKNGYIDSIDLTLLKKIVWENF